MRLIGDNNDNFLAPEGDGVDFIDGRGGNDDISRGSVRGAVDLRGGTGDDTIRADYGDVADGGPGIDVLQMFLSTFEGSTIARFGGSGSLSTSSVNETRTLTYSNFERFDVAVASDLDWILEGRGEADSLDGGSGNDRVLGRGGDDRLSGATGRDTLLGGKGDDQLYGSFDNDDQIGWRLDESDANDVMRGQGGSDALFGFGGNDRMFGNKDRDFLNGGPGSDRMFGGKGHDQLFGGLGNDDLRGGAGNDVLWGDYDSVRLSRFGSYDGGQDVLRGGGGNDTFAFDLNTGSGDLAPSRATADVIQDFQIGKDKIALYHLEAFGRSFDGTLNEDAFIGLASFSGDTGAGDDVIGEVRSYQQGRNTFLSIDIDGDAAEDYALKIRGLVDLQAQDFIITDRLGDF